MDRHSFLDHLTAYRPFDTAEVEMRDRMVEFVTRHDRCFDREFPEGHITASCWIVNALPEGARQRGQALLTWHKRLNRWLQMGGHLAEVSGLQVSAHLNRWLQMGGHLEAGDLSLLEASLREAREESGLTRVRPVSAAVFDLDVHLIPERKGEPAHYHYDVRFLLEADPAEALVVSAESKDVAWVPLSGIAALNTDASMRRMVAKTVRI